MFSRPYKPFAKLINKAALQTALNFFYENILSIQKVAVSLRLPPTRNGAETNKLLHNN